MKYFDKVEIVKVVLTHECNLACPYCSDNLSKWKKEEFTLDDACINWLKKLPRLRIVTLYGGEPLLFKNAITYAKRLLNELPNNITICFFTNGTMVNDELLELLSNPRISLNLTRSSDKFSQDLRVFKNSGLSSYQTVTDNIKGLYKVCGPRLLIVDTLHLDSLNNLSNSIIEDFNYSDFVELNMIRSQYEFQDFDTFGNELNKVVEFLLNNPNKCLKNFSKQPPTNPMIKRNWYQFVQGVYTDYVNGVKNVLIDIDGNIYPGTSVAGKGFSMGNIFGDINEETYNLFYEARETCDCEYKNMCVPNYENYNPDNVKLPFKQDSHCNYFKTLHGAMSNYYNGLRERGYI